MTKKLSTELLTALVLAAGLVFATSALARQAASLELRVVPQTGSPVNVVEDLSGAFNTPVVGTPVFRDRRFEVQYRLIDTDTTDGIVPFGLQRTRLDITSAISGSLNAIWMEPVLLSRFEAQNHAWATPPAPRDTSGPNTSAIPSRGLHTPFRGSLTFPDFPENGLVSAGPDGSPRITGIRPTCSAFFTGFGTGQYSVPGTVNGDAAGDWYGLYSFYIQVGTPSVDTQITVTASLSSELGPASFAWFPSDGSEPRIAFQSASASAGVMVLIPAPSAALALLPMFLAATRRRRT